MSLSNIFDAKSFSWTLQVFPLKIFFMYGHPPPKQNSFWDYFWPVAAILVAIGLLIYFWGDLTNKNRLDDCLKKVEQFHQDSRDIEVERTNHKHEVNTLNALLSKEKRATKAIRKQFKAKEARRKAEVKKILEAATIPEGNMAPFFRTIKCFGSKCLMERIYP